MRVLRDGVLTIALAAFLLSAAIEIPLNFRGIYYAQINSLKIEEEFGYSEEIIRTAFDEMMDYCVGGGEAAGREFRTGDLPWTEEGKAHFDDVTALFRLNHIIFWSSLSLLIISGVYFLIARKFQIRGGSSQIDATPSAGLTECKFTQSGAAQRSGSGKSSLKTFLRQRGPLFWGPVILIFFLAVLGILAAINFDAFFEWFHHVFFPGKANWILDYQRDQIVNILPETLFRNYGLIISGSIVLFSGVSIWMDLTNPLD